jgi:ribosomal protein L3 glutamine methyltransferase
LRRGIVTEYRSGMSDPNLPVLQTVRDWLRFAVSRFSEAKLTYGHGTASAMDEAAFLILETLHLPHDTLEPWLDAKLTMVERQKLADVVEKRVVTRKPAPYLVKCAWIGPHKFYCDERVIVPRSFLGELLVGGLDGVWAEAAPPQTILDLCTGSGCLAIIAAHSYPDARIDAADLSTDALAVAAHNVALHKVGARLTLHEGDLFGAVGTAKYDLILCNPPYVTAAAVAAFPPEYASEPAMAHDGGKDGMMLVRRILADAALHLTKDGVIVMEIGQGREIIARDFPDLAFLWLDTSESDGEVFALAASALADKKPGKKRGKR